MDKLTPPEALSLDGNIANNWRRWKQRYEIFTLASGLSGKEPKIQAATFLHVAGTEALEVYNTFTWETDDDKSKVDKITEKFDEYCNPRKMSPGKGTSLMRKISSSEKVSINM